MAGKIVVALAVGVLAMTQAAAVAAPGSADSTTGAVTKLENAPIPASCGHQATTLDGYSKDFGQDGFAKLRIKKLVTGHLGSKPVRRTVVPLLCSAGGVSWPELLLVYGHGDRLVGSVDLAKIPRAQEHETITGLRVSGHQVHVSFVGEDGCCDAQSTHRGLLGWKHGRLTWHHTGPLTIDFASGRSGSPGIGPGIVKKAADANLWLTPAPTKFRLFIKHRWNKLQASTRSYCSRHAEVAVDRFSHRGFASGGETACGGAAYIWAKSRGKWHPLSANQDLPGCGSATSLERRAVTALGLTCLARNGKTHTFGHWPRSGK